MPFTSSLLLLACGGGSPQELGEDKPLFEQAPLAERSHHHDHGSPPSAQALTAGDGYSCAVNPHGRMICWGDGPLVGMADENMTAVSGSFRHVCALQEEGGQVKCWGPEGPLRTPPPGAFTQLAVGASHACALAEDGTATCWGDAPALPPGPYRQLAAGDGTTCAIRTDGGTGCWGKLTSAPEGLAAVAVGPAHACGITAAGLTCWGADPDGRATPPAGTGFTHVTAGATHSCALDAAGKAVCWGTDTHGERKAPPHVFVQIQAGTHHTCATTSDANVGCWGLNDRGQNP